MIYNYLRGFNSYDSVADLPRHSPIISSEMLFHRIASALRPTLPVKPV